MITDIDNLLDIVKNSETINEVLIKLGNNNSSLSYKHFRLLVEKYNIDISHFLTKSQFMRKMQKEHKLKKYDKSEIFRENSTVTRQTVKNMLINDNILNYECCFCGNEGEWMGKKITLILDHINGTNNDNRIENLRFVCPNCNSTLETHCIGHKALIKKSIKVDKRKIYKPNKIEGKRKTDRPSLEALINDVEKLGYCGTGRKYGVSDNCIRKWIFWAKRIDDYNKEIDNIV